MPVDLIVLYAPPADPVAFDRHYTEVHAPLARAIPGLLEYECSRGPVDVHDGPPVHLVARLRYASVADLDAGLASPEGQAALADLATFADAGTTTIVATTGPA